MLCRTQHQDEFSSVMVILCDYKLRKFQRRMLAPDEVLVTKMSEIEEALYRSKTKLNAALARSRIKSRVLSIDWLLPDSVRKNEKIGSRMHVTCWVNFIKTTSDSHCTLHTRKHVPCSSTYVILVRTFRYASPSLWSQVPDSFRQTQPIFLFHGLPLLCVSHRIVLLIHYSHTIVHEYLSIPLSIPA